MLKLRKIEINDKDIVLDYIKEMVASGSNLDGIWYENESDFEAMIRALKSHETLEYIGYHQVKPINYQYLLIREKDERLVGMVSIRPFITQRLDESFGGSIGYSIRPSERRKGYATLGLKLAIEQTLLYNPLGEVLVCCNRDNIGSRKAILHNGGVLIETKEAIVAVEKYKIKL